MKRRRFIPHILLLVGGLGYALWSFVRRPFPMLGEESPWLDLVDYHTPNLYGWLMLWDYASPCVAVLLAGFLARSVWTSGGGISRPSASSRQRGSSGGISLQGGKPYAAGSFRLKRV